MLYEGKFIVCEDNVVWRIEWEFVMFCLWGLKRVISYLKFIDIFYNLIYLFISLCCKVIINWYVNK